MLAAQVRHHLHFIQEIGFLLVLYVLMEPVLHQLDFRDIPGILGTGPGREALFLLVAPYGVTSAEACAPRPDGYF